MKKIKIGFLPLLFLLAVAGCSYSSYPPRPYYNSPYGYGYGNRYVRPPRVVVVRPAPRVVYRNTQPRHRYHAPNNARPNYDSRHSGSRAMVPGVIGIIPAGAVPPDQGRMGD